jgi:type IV pilus assembly protein PilC
MPKFIYKIADKKGAIIEGTIRSVFKRGAEKKLKSGGSVIISIRPEKSNLFEKELFWGGFSKTEHINFFRNLSAMIASGISIVEALEILADQVKSAKTKKVIFAMAAETRNGQKIAKAMAKYPKHFSASIVETINMGDIAGKLSEVLDRIADDLEKDDEIRKKVVGAIAYPTVITAVMIVVMIAFAFFILPGMGRVFEELGAPTPLPTRIILASSDFVKQYPAALSGTILGLVALFFVFLRIYKTRYLMHNLILKIPLFGDMIKGYNLIILFRSLETLYASGVSLAYSVEIAQKTVTNEVYKKVLTTIQPTLLHGVPFTAAIEPFVKLFSKQTQKIVWVGEKTGRVSESLNRVVRYYERSVDYKTRMLTIMIEPILMVVIGIIVGGLALSIFMPLYGMIKII